MFKLPCFSKALLLGLCFSFLLLPLTAQKWKKGFDKSEKFYLKGDYKLAKETNHLLKVKSRRVLGVQNKMLASAHFKDAKYFAAAGYIKEYRKIIWRGLNTSKGINGKNDVAYAIAALEGTDILIENGDYLNAELLLKEIKAILSKRNSLSKKYSQAIEVQMAKIYTGQGFYEKALKLLPSNKTFMLSQLEEKESYYDEKIEKILKRDLSTVESTQRKRDYATFLSSIGNIYRKQKELEKSQTALATASSWIRTNLSESDISFIKNEHLILLAAKESPSIKDYENLLSLAKKSLRPNHQEIVKITDELLKLCTETQNIKKYKKLKKDREKLIASYYGKTSIYDFSGKLLDLYANPTKLTVEEIGNLSMFLLASNEALPKLHEKRIELLTFIHKKSVGEEKVNIAKEILKISEALFGKESPKYQSAISSLK